MKPIECASGISSSRQRLYIPGGWEAPIAEIRPDPDSVKAYAAAMGTVDEALRRLQLVYDGGYLRLLRKAVAARAQEYHRMYPQHARDIKVGRRTLTALWGFDPQRAALTFLPFDNPGRQGNPWIKKTLMEMGDAA